MEALLILNVCAQKIYYGIEDTNQLNFRSSSIYHELCLSSLADFYSTFLPTPTLKHRRY